MPLRCSAAELQPQEVEIVWWAGQELNLRHPRLQRSALPAELPTRRGAVPWSRPRTLRVFTPALFYPSSNSVMLAERARIELVRVDRQSTGSPAAIALRGCYFVGYLSRIELELPESQTGVQATTPGVPCEEWWEGETAHGHRPS